MAAFSLDELKDIQGLVLSGYGHLPSTAYLFLQIDDAVAARRWLADVTPAITTAEPWEHRGDGTKVKPPVAVNLGFTFAGLRKLGLPEDALGTFELEFSLGAAARGELLGDVGACAPTHWEFGGPGSADIHALVIVNAGDDDGLDAACESLRGRPGASDGGIRTVDEQRGFRPASSKEAFGFLDSVSQPVIERTPGQRPSSATVVPTGEFVLGYLNGYDEYPLTPGLPGAHDPSDVLPPLPGDGVPGWKDLGRHGSFLVYRKLAQDVAGFWNAMAAHASAASAGPDIQEMIRLAAKCVGRWPSGTPLTLAPERDDATPGSGSDRINDFLYEPTDAAGFGCPIGAHIRRANPRDGRLNESSEESLRTSDLHRILRRGTYFGPDLFPREDVQRGRIPTELHDDGRERGLHFVALNASIRRQFEFVQTTWINQPTFQGLFDNKDPIVGDNDGTGTMTIQKAPVRQRLLNLPRFVSVRAAGYFFLPSLTTMRWLAAPSVGGGSP